MGVLLSTARYPPESAAASSNHFQSNPSYVPSNRKAARQSNGRGRNKSIKQGDFEIPVDGDIDAEVLRAHTPSATRHATTRHAQGSTSSASSSSSAERLGGRAHGAARCGAGRAHQHGRSPTGTRSSGASRQQQHQHDHHDHRSRTDSVA